MDEVFIVQSSASGKAASLEQFYVAVSRGKQRVRVYTDSITRLRASIHRTSNREAGVELAERAGHRVSFSKHRNLYARLLHQWRQTRNQAIEAAWRTRRQIRQPRLNPKLARTLRYSYEHQPIITSHQKAQRKAQCWINTSHNSPNHQT